MMLKQKLQHLHGFTLVELMIVTAVLTILAGVLVVGYGTWRQSVAQKEVQTDLQTAAVAMVSSRNFNDEYPTSLPSTFKSSPNVQLTYVSGSDTGYCIEAASKADPSIKYYLSSNSKVPVPGTCAGIVLVDESGSGSGSTPACNSGDALSGTTCTHTYTATYENGGYSCPSGGALSGTTCTVSTAASYSSGGGYYGCPSGGSLSGTTCSGTSSYAASYSAGSSAYYSCDYGSLSGTTCYSTDQAASYPGGGYWCQDGSTPSGSTCTYTQPATYHPATSAYYYCPSGGSLSGSTCTSSSNYAATYYTYSGYYYCSSGATLSGSSCISTYTATQGGGAYTCPSGGTLSGTTCTQTYTAS